MVKVTELNVGDYLGLSSWAQSDHMDPQKQRIFFAWQAKRMRQRKVREIKGVGGTPPILVALKIGEEDQEQKMWVASRP